MERIDGMSLKYPPRKPSVVPELVCVLEGALRYSDAQVAPHTN